MFRVARKSPTVVLTLSACVFLGIGGLGPARAQQGTAEQPPYEESLLRLSEVMGSIHYLRALCGANDGSQWRDKMNALLEVEADDADRRRKLVERFNRGYRSFASVYRECTASARSSTERYMSEGEALASDITSRYSR